MPLEWPRMEQNSQSHGHSKIQMDPTCQNAVDSPGRPRKPLEAKVRPWEAPGRSTGKDHGLGMALKAPELIHFGHGAQWPIAIVAMDCGNSMFKLEAFWAFATAPWDLG